jgi:hypothetical protein
MRNSPACVTEEPKPYPFETGVWTNCGMSTNELYIPNPSRNPARLVVQTPRMRIIPMSTSGLGDLVSVQIHTTATTTPTAMSPSVRADSQPQLGASLIATSRHTSQSERSAAPVQSTVPGARTGDSGMISIVATTETAVTASGIQNSQW